MTRRSWRRVLFAATMALTAGAAGLVGSAPAQARPVQAWSFSVTGEPGDPITAGNSYSYSSAAPTPGDEMSAWGGEQRRFGMEFWSDTDNTWRLDISAPAGQTLKAGDTYQNVSQPVYGSDAASLQLYNGGWGRSCAQSTGSFTVLDAAWGPFDYVERFDATFEIRCAGATGGLRGEIHISNPPPVPALYVTLTVDPVATVSNKGIATVRGTVTCTRAETIDVGGDLTQQQKKAGLVRGRYDIQVPCAPGRAVPWSATTYPADVRFQRGTAQAVTEVPVRDFEYWNEYTVTDTSTLTLTR
ncbi:hypothetical protein O7598_25055 [Micromonospora sp. WMMC241]|uniref:hypothetical protein n=1 Tax=Micromonospora sp. WMMC241 TaxID=3015159 RepID=UPI0022B6598D|nr:hypothetical protein [Micromonospora sp. WMMC241]MCZ7439694.1 hypothetical protein [Micromonospora sp. WMMC241]